MKNKVLAIIIPCKNEEEIIEESNAKLLEILGIITSSNAASTNSFLLYVEDGSTDTTWEKIKELSQKSNSVKGIRLERNVGQQHALRQGLLYALDKADVFVTIDIDLQDDPYAICEMVKKYNEGAKIVYGVRDNRDSDSLLKRFLSWGYYNTLKILGVKSIKNHSEFRLMDKEVVKEITKYNNSNLYLRGLCHKMDVKSDEVHYPRYPRTKGQSKYNYQRLVQTAFDGITTAGDIPLLFIVYFGVFNLLLGAAMFIANMFNSQIIYGLLFSMFGIIEITIGLIGQYIARILMQLQMPKEVNIIDKTKDRK